MFGNLPCRRLGAVIEFGEAVLLRQPAVPNPLGQVLAEGFCHGEDDASLAYGVVLHVVELSVGVGVVLGIQTVQVHGLEQRRALEGRFGQVGQIHARGVALVLDVQAELLARRAGGSDGVDVLHHQSPVGQLRTARGALQQLDVESLGVVRQVAGELTHLVGHASVGIFVGHGQYLIGLQGRVERDVAEGRTQVVVAGREQTGTLQFFVVDASLKSRDGIEHLCGLRKVACLGVLVHDGGVLVVGPVGGDGRAASRPLVVADVGGLCQVGEGHDVAVVGGGGRLVGDPHLDARDGDAAGYGRQRPHVFVVLLAEEVAEEEVAVLLVLRSRELEGVVRCASLGTHALRGRLLLTHHRLQFEFAELHVGPQTEEAAGSAHQGVVGGHGDVTRFQEFDDFILLAVVFQFQGLLVEVYRGIRVVVQLQVDFIAHATLHVQVDFLVEVKSEGLPAVRGQ